MPKRVQRRRTACGLQPARSNIAMQRRDRSAAGVGIRRVHHSGCFSAPMGTTSFHLDLVEPQPDERVTARPAAAGPPASPCVSP